MALRIYVCPKGHVWFEDGEKEDYCEWSLDNGSLCAAQPLEEVSDPQRILAFAQDASNAGQPADGIHPLADTALWRRMLQLDPEFARAYLRLLHENEQGWGY